MSPSMFHPDEQLAQDLAGFDAVSGNIYTAMPDQHREFFAHLPYLFVATLDERQWPVATVFSGPAGFCARQMKHICGSFRHAGRTIPLRQRSIPASPSAH